MGCQSSREAEDPGRSAAASESQASAQLKQEALNCAEEMFTATKGRRFHEFYTRLTLTSYGASCKVLTAYHRTTGKKVAVKTIPKSHKHLDRQRRKVKLEIGTFRLLEDHPNAVRVLEVFEGAECYYVVMECCDGGELFDHISKKKGGFTERQAAQILRSLMLFVAHMHGKGIAHLDLKPENVMFDSEGANGVLKVLDFGSAVFVQQNEQVKNAFGTVRYASPEMANDICGQKADIWSTGVIMYILLSGKAPFLKSTDTETLNLIKGKPKVKFPSDKWAHVSQSAKDCIKLMLDPNPDSRPTAVQVLQLPWLKQQVPDTVIEADILSYLRTFANQSRIRRLLLGLMADQLVGASANALLGQFYSLDQDFSGTLEVQELIKAAKKAMPDLTDADINRMFEALDVDKTGTVDVKEFFAGLLQSMDEDKQTLVAHKSFSLMDRRGSGYITKETFFEVLLEKAGQSLHKDAAGPTPPGAISPRLEPSYSMRAAGGSGYGAQPDAVLLDPALVAELESEFAALDANGDGVLSFEEFKAILGIQSTPEGLQLSQAQPSNTLTIQEMRLAQKLAATRAASGNADPNVPLDIEQPNLETKDLLGLLSPIKRASSAMRSVSQGALSISARAEVNGNERQTTGSLRQPNSPRDMGRSVSAKDAGGVRFAGHNHPAAPVLPTVTSGKRLAMTEAAGGGAAAAVGVAMPAADAAADVVPRSGWRETPEGEHAAGSSVHGGTAALSGVAVSSKDEVVEFEDGAAVTPSAVQGIIAGEGGPEGEHLAKR